MRIDRVRIRRIAAGQDRAAWAGALADPAWLRDATVLKEEVGSGPESARGLTWVRRATVNQRDVVVKCRPVGSLAERFKLLIRHGRGDRHWKGAGWLTLKGFRTAAPCVLATASLDGATVELLVMETLPGRTVLEHLAAGDLTLREEHALARALGRMVQRFTDLHRFNRDNKPSNLIVVRTGEDPEIAIIDCVAIRPGSQAEPMLASLVIEPIDQGCPPRRTLMMAALRGAHQEIIEGELRVVMDDSPRRQIIAALWKAVAARVERLFAERQSS